MLKIELNTPDKVFTDGCLFCPGCNSVIYFTLQNDRLVRNIGSRCMCGAEIPLIDSLLRWPDVRARYHKHKTEVECYRGKEV